MIKPELGMPVLYCPKDPSYLPTTRQAAIIAKVINDNTVNLATFNEHGVAENAQNVTLIQDERVAASNGQCEWDIFHHIKVGKNALEERIELLEDNVFASLDDLDNEHEDNDVVTDADLVESPDDEDADADDNLSEDDIPGDGSDDEVEEVKDVAI